MAWTFVEMPSYLLSISWLRLICYDKNVNWEDSIKDIMTAPVQRRILLHESIDPEKAVSTIEIQEVTLGPKQKAPLHLHPCPTLGVITEGSIIYQIEGQPARHLKTGDAFYEPAFVRVARFDNDDDTLAKFVVHYLLGKDEHETVQILTK